MGRKIRTTLFLTAATVACLPLLADCGSESGGEDTDTPDTIPDDCESITSTDSLVQLAVGESHAGSVTVGAATGSLEISSEGPVSADFDSPPVDDALGTHTYTASCTGPGSGAVVFSYFESEAASACDYIVDVTCNEDSSGVCTDATAGCTDPTDDCEGESSGVTVPCTGYEFADIVSFDASCDAGSITVTSTMASPIILTTDAWQGRLQTTLYLIAGNGAEEQLIGIADDAAPFNTVNGQNPGDETTIDGEGRLVQTFSATTIAGLDSAPVSVRAGTFLSIQGTPGYGADVTVDFPNPCQ